MIQKVYPKTVEPATIARILEKYPNNPALGS